MDVDHEDHRRLLRTIKDQFVAELNQHAGFLPGSGFGIQSSRAESGTDSSYNR
jgi:hypothetical protein